MNDFASSRENVGSVPVTTNVNPSNVFDFLLLTDDDPPLGHIPTAFNFFNTFWLNGRENQSATPSAVVRPTPFICSRSSTLAFESTSRSAKVRAKSPAITSPTP